MASWKRGMKRSAAGNEVGDDGGAGDEGAAAEGQAGQGVGGEDGGDHRDEGGEGATWSCCGRRSRTEFVHDVDIVLGGERGRRIEMDLR